MCRLAGAPIVGELECSGIGTELEGDVVKSVGDLRASCRSRNTALLRELREDAHSMDLFRITSEDAEMGRMTGMVPIEQFDLDSHLLHPRFAVTKLKADGSHKVG